MTRTQRGNLRFSERIAADTTESFEHEIREESTIERLVVRIYPGAELDLRVEPYLKVAEDGPREPLITYEGKQYIDGDDDKWNFDLVEEAEPGDIVGVEVVNLDDSNGYDFVTQLSLDPGDERSLRSILGRYL